jgi:acyl-coenzyme A synthetase/AMP-(fatty) acid ligase/acyl carrier protein
VIYTSGSTGKPKGVMVEHRSICNRLEWIKDIVPIDTSDKILQKTPYTFDVSVPEFFSPLQAGAQLVMACPEGHKNPSYLVQTIQKYGITSIHFVPSMLTIFLEEKGLKNCTSLRRVFCSGEAITMAQQNRFFEIFDIELHNLYGPTEAAVEVTRWQCQPNDVGQIVPIGIPVANTQIYILDEYLQPVPIGTPGELYIAGIQVARGYLNRPELTAERFVNDPFITQSKAKMYRSGDLARHRPNGVIEYLGRVDYQIKLRGFRIELGEIEAILESHPEVHQAVVVLQEENNNKQLIAYYLGTKMIEVIDLKNHISAHLPDYMIPAQFVYMDEFPLGSSGKVKRSELPPVDIKQINQEIVYVAPRTDLEEMVAEIWSEILEIEKIGVHDNFFELGGHSLTAIRLMSRVIEAFDLTLPINLVFEKPTIATYSAHIESTIESLLAEMDAAEIATTE